LQTDYLYERRGKIDSESREKALASMVSAKDDALEASQEVLDLMPEVWTVENIEEALNKNREALKLTLPASVEYVKSAINLADLCIIESNGLWDALEHSRRVEAYVGSARKRARGEL
jgi:hypothetical protein